MLIFINGRDVQRNYADKADRTKFKGTMTTWLAQKHTPDLAQTAQKQIVKEFIILKRGMTIKKEIGNNGSLS